MDIVPPTEGDAAPLETLAPTIVSGSKSSRPDAHTQKYDRQLRLWASSGQSALENASILVVNGTATATSTLKNLVLPGIGAFTVLDDAVATEADVGNNFFLEASSVGKSRAEEVVRLVGELNTDVKGKAVAQSVEDLLASSGIAEHSLIIAVEVPPAPMRALAKSAWDSDVPLIKVRTCGFYASIRAQYKELALVETHPDNLIDLRVHAPFQALVEFAHSFDYDAMNSHEHGHVPAVVILVKAMESWRKEHDDKYPSGMDQRAAFIRSITDLKRTSDEENFDEAVALFRRAGTRNAIPDEIQALFDDDACESVSSSSPNFWLLLRAVRDFVQLPTSSGGGGGLLPLSGALPDMKAETGRYVQLQNVYRGKARADLAKVEELLARLLESVGVAKDAISKEAVETFVKHSAFLKVLRGRSLEQEEGDCALHGKLDELMMMSTMMEVPDQALSIYLAFRASESFYDEAGCWPGTAPHDEDGTADVGALTKYTTTLWSSLGAAEGDLPEETSAVVQEVCRAGASDLPQIAALVGGLVGQEAIKMVTRQYVPLASTCIFNGIQSVAGNLSP